MMGTDGCTGILSTAFIISNSEHGEVGTDGLQSRRSLETVLDGH